MILSIIPILPPELRPLIELSGGRFASSDLNALYERVIYRNNRLKRFLALEAPEVMLNNEKRLLQEACDALFDNGHRNRPLTGSGGHRLRSLTDAISGKQGHLRKHVLGKRVDYSGRSVIVGDPGLSLHQCGLPTKMCLELFKPFLIRKLLQRQYAANVRAAKRMVERTCTPDPILWDLLEEVMHEKLVLLNRAPTLHRLSIQAFEAVRVEGNAITLHPLVCSAFNADFDGDQMAVHLPLSDVAQAEARALLLSTRNLRSPASGDPSISLSQDMVLGLFYLTQDRPSRKSAGRIFADASEVLLALDAGVIDLHTRIVVRVCDQTLDETPERGTARPAHQRIETTAGRLLFNEALPEQLRFKNDAMTKERLKLLVVECLQTCGPEVTAQMADRLKSLGFHYATRSGLSFAISDIEVPPAKHAILAAADAEAEAVEQTYRAG
jgi:DNA-directed RNA polymerase subunit beta'